MEELIRSVISTMDTISITGRDNMDKFVGCMNALESIATALANCRAEPATPEEVHEEEVADG